MVTNKSHKIHSLSDSDPDSFHHILRVVLQKAIVGSLERQFVELEAEGQGFPM